MAGDRTGSNQKIEIALLKQNLTAIEHTVISQNAAVRAELGEMNTVLREIRDKLDKTILDQSVWMTAQEYKIAAANNEIARVNGRIARASAGVSALIAAVIGGLFQWFTPGK